MVKDINIFDTYSEINLRLEENKMLFLQERVFAYFPNYDKITIFYRMFLYNMLEEYLMNNFKKTINKL